ncbi:M16 family metallopeptidase [Ideonella sp. A 288]|uniref:M16 family metallopeptidase n=1 Tax=Ideonella sp. A 288 TaxID=1962181 RepID=UPI003855AC6D
MRLLLVLVLALAGRLALAQAAAALPEGLTRITEVEGVAEYRLANGLQLLLVPDDAKPTTTVNLTYRVGSRHESYGETGMAHLLEHLLFKGTPTHRNPWAEFSRRGLRANGTTSFDRTNYFASFAANPDTLRWYLGWQADAMTNSFIARADLDTEMTVVRNEMESGENNPGRILLQQTMATMYQWHNYGKGIIGARSDVENVDISRLQAFYRQHYQPDNATLIVAGKFDVAPVLRAVAELFGPIPRPTRPPVPQYTLDPVQDGERAVTLRRAGGNPMLYLAFHVPPASHPDFAAIEMLTSVLGDTPGGRLHKGLVEPRLAASAFAYAWGLADPGPLFLGAQLAPGQDVGPARDALLAAVDGLAAKPVTAEELERARTQWLNDWTQGFNDPERVGVELSEAVSHGDWRLYFLGRDQIRRLALADVQRVAAERLRRDNRTLGTYLPTSQPERAPPPQRTDLTALLKDFKGEAAVAQAEAFDATPANLDARTQRFDLAHGLKVALLPKTTRGSVVRASLRLHLGDEQSLRGQSTVAALAGSLLDKGGAGLTRQQIADQFDRWRAQVGFGIDGQTLSVSINTTREHLPAVVSLVGRLLREPAFPADVLEEGRSQWLADIERQRKEPESLVSDAIDRHGNPYPRGDLRHSPNFDEQVQDVQAVTIEQVRAFHRRFVSAARGEFAAVGDMDVPALRAALDAGLTGWRQPAGGPLAYVRVPRPLVDATPTRLVLRTPDKANATLMAVLSLPLNDLHPDFPALMVANHMFGDGGTGRLWMRIRERDGLSYSVYSGVAWSNVELNSRWVASAIFAPQNRPAVEQAFREELERSLKEGFSAQELDQARTGLLNARRLSRAQDRVVTSQLAGQLHLGRDFGLSQRVDEAIGRLTLAEVNDAWRRHIDPARLVTALGGDFPP